MPLVRNYINGQWKDVFMNDDLPTLSPAQIEAELHKRLEEYSLETYPAEHRNHLGVSAIGEECWRKLWYEFRWVKLQQAEGRMRRLWNRGHREEPQFENFLLWAGFSLRTIDPATDKQYKLSLVDGHYGGSTDGIALIRWLNDFPILVEFKTVGSKYFKEYKEKKLKLTNPKYFSQMSGYGKEFKVKWGLFAAVNKDTDEIYFEFVELDWNHAIELEKKATDIIYAKTPPNKISEQASFWKCKSCTFQGVCHFNERIETNCRSCVNATPGVGGTWVCNKYGNIPKDFIKTGCGEWKGIV